MPQPTRPRSVPRPRSIHGTPARVALASALVLGTEILSVALVLAVAAYAGRDRPSDQGFDALGRFLAAVVYGGGAAVLITLVVAMGAARIARCARPLAVGFLTIVAQIGTVVLLAWARFPHELVALGLVASVPAVLGSFAHPVPARTTTGA